MANAIIQTLSRLLSLLQPELSQPQSEVVLSVAWLGLLQGYSFSNMEWIIGQSWLESARMSSGIALTHNNPFGMSKVEVRDSTQVGYIELPDGNTFGTYPSIYAATKDRLMWDSYFGLSDAIRSEGYQELVCKKYHTSTAYCASVSDVDVKGLRTAFALLFSLIPFSYFTLKLIL